MHERGEFELDFLCVFWDGGDYLSHCAATLVSRADLEDAEGTVYFSGSNKD